MDNVPNNQKIDVVMHGALYVEYGCGCYEVFVMDSTGRTWPCSDRLKCVRPKYIDQVVEKAKEIQAAGKWQAFPAA